MTEATLGSAPVELRAAAVERERGPFARLVHAFFEDRVAVAGLGVFVALLLLALFAPWIAPQNPYDLAAVDIMDSRQPPGSMASDGFRMLLGSDGAGRDLFSAILYGLRISLAVGLVSGVLAATIGTSIGLVAAYLGGRADALIMRVVDLQLSLPAILIALILAASLGKVVDKTTLIIIALVTVQWAYYARTVRGSALVERRKEYVEAALSLDLSHARILFRHILPNCVAPVIVIAMIQTAHAIALEATLSFLGVGLPQTEPSLGVLIDNGRQYMLSGSYWISIFPGLALLVTIVAINLMGDRLRDILNPRLER